VIRWRQWGKRGSLFENRTINILSTMCTTTLDKPQATRLFSVMKLLMERDQSIYRLCRELECHERTIYRMLGTLREMGVIVVKRAPRVYYIPECPFCKREII
jgi:hypothetical protein